MKMEEFLVSNDEAPQEENTDNVNDSGVELDVQKAVVESLAADKAEQDEKIGCLEKENANLKNRLSDLEKEVIQLKEEFTKIGETLVKNSERETSNQVSLLDRNLELQDRFDGETRDHVLEILREAREQAEKDGRLRRAQVLESILVANEPSGNLEKKRSELKKLFLDNQNVINGQVINSLDNLGISYKNGEEYLLVDEIIKRTF